MKREDKKQRQKLRQTLLRELDLLEIEEVGATQVRLDEIDARRIVIAEELDRLVNERKKIKVDKHDEGEIITKQTPWERQKELCIKNGIPEKYFMSRVYQGMNEALAATKPIKTGPIFSAEQRRIMEENGINYETARGRVTKHKWSVENAITIPARGKAKKGYKMGIHDKRG